MITSNNQSAIDGLVEHLFRHESANIKARLVRVFGPAHMDEIEDVVQDALIQAVRLWPFDGVPERPAAWLFRVARNRMLDQVRRNACFNSKREQYALLVSQMASPTRSAQFDDELLDDQLALIFTCCIPQLPRKSRIALTLKIACGFSVDEIADAFLTPPKTISQRIVRAKKRLRAGDIDCRVPAPDALPERLGPVLEVIYLLFGEGHSAHSGDELIRNELCVEALRLVRILMQRPSTNTHQTRALAALICLQSARLGARIDHTGTHLLLRDQDRSRWDRSLIAQGFHYLESAADNDAELSAYHLQAAIAACHMSAQDYDSVDWSSILQFYDLLLECQPGDMVRLNRIVALAQVKGEAVALAEMSKLTDPGFRGHFLFQATRAELLERANRTEEALDWWKQAEAHELRPEQKRHIEARIAHLAATHHGN